VEDWLRKELMARVRFGLYASHHAARFVEHERATGYYKDNCSARLKWKSRLSIEADEFPAHFDFQIEATELSQLPVRLAELGTVYRYERSGVLHGLLRVRGLRRTMRTFSAAVADRSEVERASNLRMQ